MSVHGKTPPGVHFKHHHSLQRAPQYARPQQLPVFRPSRPTVLQPKSPAHAVQYARPQAFPARPFAAPQNASPATPPHMNRTPAASQAYRPQPVPVVLQRKPALVQALNALQPKTASARPQTPFDARSAFKPPTAPPVYRPGATRPAHAIQPKAGPVQFAPHAGVVRPSTVVQLAKRTAKAKPPAKGGIRKKTTVDKSDKRPGWVRNTTQTTYRRFNLSDDYKFKIKNINRPGLKKLNATMAHRMSWKDIRDRTLYFVRGEDTENDFLRWTKRLEEAGVDKVEETIKDIDNTSLVLSEKIEKGWNLEEQIRKAKKKSDKNTLKTLSEKLEKTRKKISKMEERGDSLELVLTGQNTSQEQFLKARTNLTEKIRALNEFKELKKQEEEDKKNLKRKKTQPVVVSGSNKRRKTTTVKKKQPVVDEDKLLGQVTSAKKEFYKFANSFHANVPSVDPHEGVNNPVKEQIHLNVRLSRWDRDDSRGRSRHRYSLSPTSRRIAEMSPTRMSPLAVSKEGKLISTGGFSYDFKDFSPETQNLLKRHKTKVIPSYDPHFTFGLVPTPKKGGARRKKKRK